MNKLLTTCVCTVYTKEAHVVTDISHNDSFLVTLNHDGVVNDIIARVYAYKDRWYIWYPKSRHRTPVVNFTAALEKLEREITQCVA